MAFRVAQDPGLALFWKVNHWRSVSDPVSLLKLVSSLMSCLLPRTRLLFLPAALDIFSSSYLSEAESWSPVLFLSLRS